jgi:hypothetical protein
MRYERRLVRGMDGAKFPATRAGHIRGFGIKAGSSHHYTLAGAALGLVGGDDIALEAGNSPEVIFTHYRELVTPDAAKAWFGVFFPAR